jgi:hypothetical protein
MKDRMTSKRMTETQETISEYMRERTAIMEIDVGTPRSDAEDYASSFVICGRCRHFQCHNAHGKGAGQCRVEDSTYTRWSESPPHCELYSDKP